MSALCAASGKPNFTLGKSPMLENQTGKDESIGDSQASSLFQQKPSDGFNVGSKKWHFAIADELDIQAKEDPDKQQAAYIMERAEFHRLIGQHQK